MSRSPFIDILSILLFPNTYIDQSCKIGWVEDPALNREIHDTFSIDLGVIHVIDMIDIKLH